MPVNNSPNPASTAPVARVRPLASSHRKPPNPIIGSAAAAIFTLKPKTATNHEVAVVPRLAPSTTATAWLCVTKPALTKPINVRIAALDDCTSAVNSAPDNSPLSFPETSRCKARRKASPARPFNPSLR